MTGTPRPTTRSWKARRSASERTAKHSPSHARRPTRWQTFWEKTGSYISVALGSVVGAVARFLVSVLFVSQFGDGFPWGTLFVNVTGSFVIGFYAALTGPDGRLFVSARQRLFVMVGIDARLTLFALIPMPFVSISVKVFGSAIHKRFELIDAFKQH